MKIISASRRTDIPAFFPKWFVNRLNCGYFDRVNPFNPKQIKRISLLPEEIMAFVFWTKSPQPFLSIVEELKDRGYFFIFQYTLNDYPGFFEPNLPELTEKIATFQELSQKTGKSRILWRYDPIILSTKTPVSYHLEKLHQLAELLADSTGRLTVSLYDPYQKSQKRMNALSNQMDLQVTNDYSKNFNEIQELVDGINKIAVDFDLELYSCSDELLAKAGINPAACIDGELIAHHTGCYGISRDKNQRSNCLCSESIDMGQYDSCRHFCRYCYAYLNEQKVNNNLEYKHFSSSPSLLKRL